MSGKKFDSNKPDLSLIPLSALAETAKAFMLGEQKYSRGNYKLGLESHRLVAAALRHILTWEQGESLDPESGASHLGHAMACLAMIMETQRLGTLKDTRYSITNNTEETANEKATGNPDDNYATNLPRLRLPTA